MTQSIQDYAREMLSAFERIRRDNGDEIWTLKDQYRDSPYHEIVFEIHDHYDRMPSDTIYDEIVYCLSAIADADDPAEAEVEGDTYTSDLLDWLSDDLSRMAAVDDVLKEYGGDIGLEDAIRYAQAQEKMEIVSLLVDAITERMDEDEDDIDDDDYHDAMVELGYRTVG